MLSELIEQALAINDNNINRISILVEIEPIDLSEDFDLLDEPISNKATIEDIIDDNTFDQWSNFESAIQTYIDQNYILDNISMSKNSNSVSEYIDFYVLDSEGNQKETIIDLRLSNHRPKPFNNKNRIRKVQSRLSPNQKYRLVGVTVNKETYNTYLEGFNAAKQMIDDTANSIN